MPRVKSKNLFNFQPSGCIDADILELEEKMKNEMPEAATTQKIMDEAAAMDDEASTEKFITTLRGMMDGMMDAMAKHPILTKAGEETVETKIMVPTDHDGKYDVLVHVYTPTKLEGNKQNSAYIYAHELKVHYENVALFSVPSKGEIILQDSIGKKNA